MSMPEISEALLKLPPEMRIKRIKGTGRPIAQIIPEIANFISESQSVRELCELIDPRKRLELNEESLNSHIDWLEQRANYASYSFVLFDGRYGKNGASLGISLGHHSNLEELTIRMSKNFLQQDDVSDQIIELISKIGQSFDAFTGYVNQHQEVVFNENYNISISKFDSSKIPCGIWWINYWNQEQVDNVGRERVMNAGWLKAIELPNKSIVTAMTSELPNLVSNPQHLQRFELVSKTLNLKALQETTQASKYFKYDSY